VGNESKKKNSRRTLSAAAACPKKRTVEMGVRAVIMLPLACLLSTAPAVPMTEKYALDPSWPVDLAKIGPMNGTSGVDVNPVTGEVYMCQQRGSPRVSVWDGKTGKLLRQWGDGVLDTPHAVRVLMVHGGEPQIFITDMGACVRVIVLLSSSRAVTRAAPPTTALRAVAICRCRPQPEDRPHCKGIHTGR
jgi:DNA-binding beta-propeller fold protein YncE